MSDPSTAPAPSAQPSPVCTACGAKLEGRYCTECGASAGLGPCHACGADLSPGARYCHRCGTEVRPAVPPRRERLAWGVAGAITLVTVALVALQMGRGRLPAPAVPAMGTAGNAAPGRPPDISQMSPRERFDRLFERVMGAAERGSTDTVARFAPMALSAYSQLADADARYHAAMIRLAVGDLAEAKALADTILAAQPGHLFGYLIRGDVAEAENDATALARSYEDFLKAYDARDGATSGRPEYDDHRPALEDFRTRAAGRGGR